MLTAATAPTTPAITTQHDARAPNGVPQKRVPKPISWTEFRRRYSQREDGFKYEWLNGLVAKSSAMDFTQFFIVKNLLAFFRQLVAQKHLGGELMPEGDIFFGKNHRRPDVSYLTDEQIARTAYGENQVPLFVIEVISKKDQMELVHEKMDDFRASGVLVVWHIFPLREQVHVYRGPNLSQMTVCTGAAICSAAPVLPDFELTANAIFQKPPKPA
ncbi:MAG: Uma2 family endonuclease [Saprospiraceae bacterium]